MRFLGRVLFRLFGSSRFVGGFALHLLYEVAISLIFFWLFALDAAWIGANFNGIGAVFVSIGAVFAHIGAVLPNIAIIRHKSIQTPYPSNDHQTSAKGNYLIKP